VEKYIITGEVGTVMQGSVVVWIYGMRLYFSRNWHELGCLVLAGVDFYGAAEYTGYLETVTLEVDGRTDMEPSKCWALTCQFIT